jgi:hypothetical protein
MAGVSPCNIMASAVGGGLMSAAIADVPSFGDADEPPQGAVNARTAGGLP